VVEWQSNRLTAFTQHHLMQDLQQEGEKIILLVMDGLGGLPMKLGGQTALESAHTPNLDRMATAGSTGLRIPIRAKVLNLGAVQPISACSAMILSNIPLDEAYSKPWESASS